MENINDGSSEMVLDIMPNHLVLPKINEKYKKRMNDDYFQIEHPQHYNGLLQILGDSLYSDKFSIVEKLPMEWWFYREEDEIEELCVYQKRAFLEFLKQKNIFVLKNIAKINSENLTEIICTLMKNDQIRKRMQKFFPPVSQLSSHENLLNLFIVNRQENSFNSENNSPFLFKSIFCRKTTFYEPTQSELMNGIENLVRDNILTLSTIHLVSSLLLNNENTNYFGISFNEMQLQIEMSKEDVRNVIFIYSHQINIFSFSIYSKKTKNFYYFEPFNSYSSIQGRSNFYLSKKVFLNLEIKIDSCFFFTLENQTNVDVQILFILENLFFGFPFKVLKDDIYYNFNNFQIQNCEQKSSFLLEREKLNLYFQLLHHNYHSHCSHCSYCNENFNSQRNSKKKKGRNNKTSQGNN